MDRIVEMTKQFVQEGIDEIINGDKLDEKYLKIILYRYGLKGNKIHTLRQISRKMGIKMKNVKDEVKEAERRTFNILKKKI